ncbi:uncharacterized protein [Haliotis cracherodii]|uniref:uncharacterized protein n=1 Tax=Haliotis cracherodii TaxID=6455 RepID=UPI0039ECACF2
MGGFCASTLNITGVEKIDTGDRYSCQIVEKQGFKTDWSQEYIVGVNTWMESYTENTVVREGNNATVTWKMPLFKVFITSPTGREVLTVNSTNIYISNSYWSRVKILGVTHSPDAVVVRFTLYNTKRDDVGRYYCTRAPDGNADSSCDQIIVVSPTLTRYDSPKSKRVIISWNRKHVEGTFSILSYPAPKKHEILLLLGDSHLDRTYSLRHLLESRRIGVNKVLLEYTFSINNLRKEDLGTYNVIIDNGERSITLSMDLLEPASRISLTMVIAIACTVVIVIASMVISILILVYKRLKNKEMSRRSALSYISAVQEAGAAAGRVYYSGYHVYADVDNSEIQDKIQGHRRASDSSSDDYEEVGQAFIAIHPQPEDQDQVQIAENQIPNIDVREPSQAQHSSRQASDKSDTRPIVESSLHISSRDKSDTASATSATPYYLTARDDKTSPQPSSSKTPDTPGATSATPYYLTATGDKTSSQPSSSMTPDTASATSATPYYLTATEDKKNPQLSSSMTPDTPGATSATPYYLTATEDKTSPQPSSSKKPDTASATSATPYYLTATEAKTSPQPSSSKKPDTASATSATPYYLTATEDKTSPQPSSNKKPDTPGATSATPYYLTATGDKTSPQSSSIKTPDSASAASATPYYLTATSSSEKPYTASATLTTPHHLTDAGDECSPKPSLAEEPDTPTATATPHYLADAGDESSPQPSSTENTDTPTATSAGPYYLTDTEDESSPQPSSYEKPDTPTATSTPHYLGDVVDESSPQPSSTEKPDAPTGTSAGPYYLTDTEDE